MGASYKTIVELSSANLHRDEKYPKLFHIQEKKAQKKLSFQDTTLRTLIQSKHIYHYPLQIMIDFLAKADNIIDILIENFDVYDSNFTEKELNLGKLTKNLRVYGEFMV
jgi:hypothetical protein